MSRRALLLGATGLVGGHCLRLLLDCDAYQEVRVLTRRPLGIDHPKLIEKVVEPAQFDKETEYFQVDDVFCDEFLHEGCEYPRVLLLGLCLQRLQLTVGRG